MGKFVDRSLAETGAKRIMPLGMGDDQKDLEADFENWKDTVFWPALKKKYISVEGTATLEKESKKKTKSKKMPKCNYVIEYVEGAVEQPDDTPVDKVHLSSKHYFTAETCPITTRRELRSPADDGSTLHLEIDTSQTSAQKYQTADNLGILPLNSSSVVTSIAEALSYDLDATFRLLPAVGKEDKHTALFPNPCTIRECLTRYCDLTGSPRRSELKLLAAYATDKTSKDALLRMSSKEGKAEYREKIVDAKIGIVDIITRLCPSMEIPLEHFISVCPRLQPRYYTISSSSSVHPDSVHVTVSVLEGERVDGSMFKGVCTNHLKDVGEVGGSVRAFVRPSTFRLPSDTSKPIIMIGPGTGIAPMRGLLQERAHQKQTLQLPVGDNILYFGCKKRSLDFLYSDELESFQTDGVLTTMHLAFSREQKKKVYVQHLLAENGSDTWDLIDGQGAYVYVCGGIKMGNDVAAALRSIVGKEGGRSVDDAKAYLDDMASKGRFVQELWA
eukprot:CAMPEP_0198257306 /NCGR_PEP_ID=MMETSP1447-20131203/7024_1 /TAXON_ID=420782 /ORGANISM="Chaetoceros dichaeta, Strain CCMP1751" /LENGTH=500 /DNA_ID=CAMNT_0043944183 /DNA_START=1007 /DNA_END=2509 /DNA_ORIENTATION=-